MAVTDVHAEERSTFVWLLSPHSSVVSPPLPPGHRASEGRDGEVGEGAVSGGGADGVRRPLLFVLVQPVQRAELQEEPRGARHRPSGGDHRGGRHRDPTHLASGRARRLWTQCFYYIARGHLKFGSLYLYIYIFFFFIPHVHFLSQRISAMSEVLREANFYQTSASCPFIKCTVIAHTVKRNSNTPVDIIL